MNYLHVTNRQRLELWHVTNIVIMTTLESKPPVLSQPPSKSNRSLLERFFDYLLLLLERLISAAVKAALDRLEERKENFKEWLRQLWQLMWS